MSAESLLKAQAEGAGKMLEVLFEAIGPQNADHKPHTNTMSGRETLAHLTECYIALEESLRDEKHAWGSYTAPADWAESLAEFREKRAWAIEKSLEIGTEAAYHHISDFVVHHDNYHVGQLVSVKLSQDPTWNSYSIYE